MKKILWTIMMLFIATTVFCLNSENYLIGEYYSDATQGDIDLLDLLQNANINSLNQSFWGAATDIHYIEEMMELFNEYELDIRIIDYAWTDEIKGAHIPTYCGYYKFEAEYIHFTHVVGIPEFQDEWFYYFDYDNSTGATIEDYLEYPEYDPSNDFVLRCIQSDSGDQSCMAIGDIRCRDGMRNEGELIKILIPAKRITGPDLDPVITQYQITWRMRGEDLDDFNADDIICNLGVRIAEGTEPHNADIIDIDPNLLNSPEYTFSLTKQDFIDNGAIGGYSDFTFTLDLLALEEMPIPNLKVAESQYYFCPTVEFCDKGILYIDYIIITDDLYLDLAENHIYDGAIQNRVGDILAKNIYDNNLLGFYSKDEPRPPDFDAYNYVDQLIDSTLNNTDNIRLQTAISSFHWKPTDPGETPYLNPNLFNEIAHPEEISTDRYLYGNHTCSWNDLTANPDDNIQKLISDLTQYYSDVKNICIDPEKPFVPIIHAYGAWCHRYENEEPESEYEYWSGMMLPPSKHQKALMYLPLCYGADGIHIYRMVSYYSPDIYNEVENLFGGINEYLIEEQEREYTYRYDRICSIQKENDNWVTTPQYDAIKTANEMIEYCGPIIKQLNWLGAGHDENILEEGNIQSITGLESISIIEDDEAYNGFIEIGVYENYENEIYFMLVNRRTNYSKPEFTDPYGLIYIDSIPIDVEIAFDDASPQVIELVFNNLDPDIVLLDQYSGYSWSHNNSSFFVEIDPGEGMLLKFGELPIPAIIDDNSNYILGEGDNIPYPIIINGNASIGITGSVTFGINSSITINEGGSLVLYDVSSSNTISFGDSALINVYGDLTMIGCNLKSISRNWKGINCYENGNISFESVTIEDALTGCTNRGNLDFFLENAFINCDVGIELFSDQIQVNNESSVNISVDLTNGQKGIILNYKPESVDDYYLYLNNFTFSNLHKGVTVPNIMFNPSFNSYNVYIANSEFTNNNYGIYSTGDLYSHFISNSTFTIAEGGTGIRSLVSRIDVDSCSFYNGLLGISLSQCISGRSSIPPPNSFIKNSTFFNQEQGGINCEQSSLRFENNHMLNDHRNINISNSSFLNCSRGANNCFEANIFNLLLIGQNNTLWLNKGHNDFYNYLNQYHKFIASDTCPDTLNIGDASYNFWTLEYFGDTSYLPIVPDESTLGFVTGVFLPICEEPNTDFDPLIPQLRFEIANELELEGDYEGALSIYESILNDYLLEELFYIIPSIDRVFYLSIFLNVEIDELKNYFIALENQYQNNQQIIETLQQYIKRCCILNQEFQEAADIICEFLDVCETEIDSLIHIIDLEETYLLSDFYDTRSPINTIYPSCKKSNIAEYDLSRLRNNNRLYELINSEFNIDGPQDNIPPVSVLYSNYPNPFNPITTISFSIPKDSKVNLSIYNIKGQKVKTLTDSKFERGIHQLIWDSKDSNGKAVSSGIYFYKLDVNGKSKAVNKMLLLK